MRNILRVHVWHVDVTLGEEMLIWGFSFLLLYSQKMWTVWCGFIRYNLLQKAPVYKDHLIIKTAFYTGAQVYNFRAIEPAFKDQLCIRATFCWSLGWSLYTSFTVLQKVPLNGLSQNIATRSDWASCVGKIVTCHAPYFTCISVSLQENLCLKYVLITSAFFALLWNFM